MRRSKHTGGHGAGTRNNLGILGVVGDLRRLGDDLSHGDGEISALCRTVADRLSSVATARIWDQAGPKVLEHATHRIMYQLQEMRLREQILHGNGEVAAAPIDTEPGDAIVVSLLRRLTAAKGAYAETLEAFENERISRENREKESQGGFLLALARVLEARCPETAEHCDRLARGSGEIASRLGLSAVEVTDVQIGAYLHDIGKVGIPDAILWKRGPLSEEEWTRMRCHPIIGTQMIASMHHLVGASLVVRHHHERFDGDGYPDGLRGAAIPIGARIVAVVDAYDSLRHDRPYRKAVSTTQALRVLVAESGRQLDPTVLEASLRVLEHDERRPA